MDQYYVYKHIHPETDKVMYIGKGSFERAWLCRGSNRESDYKKQLTELFAAGYTMADIVEITNKNLTKEEATKIELELIQRHKPQFNKLSNPDWQYPNARMREFEPMIKALREMGYGCQNIAFLLGGDKVANAMSIWRYIK